MSVACGTLDPRTSRRAASRGGSRPPAGPGATANSGYGALRCQVGAFGPGHSRRPVRPMRGQGPAWPPEGKPRLAARRQARPGRQSATRPGRQTVTGPGSYRSYSQDEPGGGTLCRNMAASATSWCAILRPSRSAHHRRRARQSRQAVITVQTGGRSTCWSRRPPRTLDRRTVLKADTRTRPSPTPGSPGLGSPPRRSRSHDRHAPVIGGSPNRYWIDLSLGEEAR